MPLWKSLILQQLIPSIFDAGLMLLVVLAIFKFFRVNNPATRFLFLFVPLIKPFLILLDRPGIILGHALADRTVSFSLRLPDPLNLITSPFRESLAVRYHGSALAETTVIVVALIVVFLIIRWVQLFAFLQRLRSEPVLSPDKYSHIYEMLDGLVAKLETARPKIVLSSNYHFVPFSFGQRNAVIVLSETLIATFPKEQLEIMLAHELAHLKRNDSRAGWIALALRDTLFFNPFSHLAYRMIEEEKERACDRIALEVTRRKPAEVAHTLVDVALFYQSIRIPKRVLHPAPTKGFLYRESFLTRRIRLINTPIVTNDPTRRRKVLKYILFFLLLYIQVGFIWHNGDYLIMFR